MKLYPLQFQPIFKQRIWGGRKLKTIFNKPIPTDTTGESWEISTITGDVSIVQNGIYQDIPLTNLINLFPVEILGTKVYAQFGKQFPLLFKFLDAQQDLSIQVHPNDELAQQRHNSFGKTEMWYVIQADENARLIVGFKENQTRETYLENLKNKSILDILQTKNVSEGDTFLLNTGTVHALGAGILIAEIQQTSDITYRIYDFDRKDADGNERELHTELALDAINFTINNSEKYYETHPNNANTMVECNYFTTNIIPLEGSMTCLKNKESFTVLMCVEGAFQLNFNHQTYQYSIGETVLIPAEINEYELIGKAKILEIYI